MSQVSLPLPAVNFLDCIFEMAVFDVLVKIVVARTRARRPRAAFVGFDPHLMGNLEGIQDSLIDFSNSGEARITSDSNADWRLSFNCFEGKPGDMDRPSQAMSKLAVSDYDLICVSDIDPGRDAALLDAVKALCVAQSASSPLVVSFGRLRTGLIVALQNLRHGAYFTCLNPRKTATVAICLFLSSAASGCAVECGTYLGGTSVLMGLMMRSCNDQRRVHTFDTFEGLPKSTGSDGKTVFTGGTFAETSLAQVAEFVRAHGLSDSVFPHKGLIQEELPKLWDKEKEVSFCFADTDQYEGTAATLATVVPRLHPKGLIVVDDCFEHGVQRAIEEAMTAHPDLAGGLVTHSVFLLWKK